MNVRRRRSGSALRHDYTTYDVVNTLDQLVENTSALTHTLRESAERSTESDPALPDALAPMYGHCLDGLAAAVEAYGAFVTMDEGEASHELRDAVQRASSGHERLTERVQLSSVPDVGALEVLGPLLSELRRMIRQLDI